MNKRDRKAWAACHRINLTMISPLCDQLDALRGQKNAPGAPIEVRQEFYRVQNEIHKAYYLAGEAVKDTELRKASREYFRLHDLGDTAGAAVALKRYQRLDAEMRRYRRSLGSCILSVAQVAAGGETYGH